MIDFLPFLKIAPLFFIALVIPGPDFIFVSATSLSHGRSAGIQAAAGIATGLLFYCGFSVWGLGIVFDQMTGLVQIIKICGGLYLIYLGYQLWRASLAPTTDDANTAQPAPSQLKSPYRSGILTNLTNPKAIAFFASVFALALTPATNTPTKVATTVLCCLMAFAWFAFVAYALSAPRVRRVYLSLRKIIDRLAGTLLLVFGTKLVFSGK